MIQQLPTHRESCNFATADRPRYMLRDESYVRQNRNYRSFDYEPNDYDDDTTWFHQPNGNVISSAKKSQHKSKQHAFNSSRSQTSSSSGFQSFFRWFKKDDKSRLSDISYPREITSSTDTFEYEHDREKRLPRSYRRKLKTYDSNDTLSPPTTPRLSRNFSAQSSSCDSVFSTASSFAFVPPTKYLRNRNQRQPETTIVDRTSTESYQRRSKVRDQDRDLDKRNEVNLRRKYQLYGESDAETNNNTLKAEDNFNIASRRYQDLSLPAIRKTTNVPDSVKLHDLSLTKQHRRTSSDSSKDKKAGAYVHVKGKRKAPAPPQTGTNPRTLSPKSSLARKKRPAPKPPVIRDLEEAAAAASSTSLLEDKEIKALIEGTAILTRNLTTPSTSSIPSDMERRTYVSPYLKIREDRKLTDEQKRILIDQVSRNVRKKEEKESPAKESPHATQSSTPDIFTIERGQLVYQGNESPKLPPKEEKLVAPPSPLSPRPWFKRQSSSNKDVNQTTLKTTEKRKHKNGDKEMPEVGHSRHSFFGNRFNIFARITDDPKKKERDAEKRRSQIGIPNISELDREAVAIIQRNELNVKGQLSASEMLMLRSQISNLKESLIDDDERPRSAKDLINKFEADTTQGTRITINPAYVGRKEFFNDNFSSEPRKPLINELKIEEKLEEPLYKSKLPQMIKETNGIRKQNDLMGLWTCPYCTLQNPNWKIICGACEKIKPYEKRFLPNGELIKLNPSPPKNLQTETEPKENVWEKRTEHVLKYFNPPPTNGLAKSSSETAIAKSLKRKSPSPSRIAGSPKTNSRRNFFKTASEDQEPQIEAIEEEPGEKLLESVKVKPTLFNADRIRNSPNLSDIRSARLAKFNLMPKNVDDEKANTNRKQSPEKRFPDKLDFSDPVALEIEKERLREKIRAMNAKALADKYPVLKRQPEIVENGHVIQPLAEPSAPPASPANTTESSRLGAIRKTFKSAFETRRGSFDKEKSEEKIINKDEKLAPQPPKRRISEATIEETLEIVSSVQPVLEKNEKISISIQTTLDAKRGARQKEEPIFLPTTVTEITQEKAQRRDSNILIKQQEEFEEISDQLKSKDGIESFKATLRSINKTNTFAINKILRDLENAIADGKYDAAAQLAMDLAKMKVSLSVTRQRDRPKSDIDPQFRNVRVNLTVKNGTKDIATTLLEIPLMMSVNDFKKKIEKEFKVPMTSQKLLMNNVLLSKGENRLEDCGVIGDVVDAIIYSQPDNRLRNNFEKVLRQDSFSDDESQNEKVGNDEGAVGRNQIKLKLDNEGWECPLCTLVNIPNRPGCLACSTTRPASYKVPSQYEDIEYKLKVNEDLRTFFDMEKVVDARPKSQKKNDLNRQSANRKSSEIFNILVDEKKPEPLEPAGPVVSSPNITKIKYRGVDNYNPNMLFAFPKVSEVRRPIITSVIYKSSLTNAKETVKENKNHYQELVNLDMSDIAPNLEKFECSICFLTTEPRGGAVLRECLHSFCKECLASHIKYSDEAEIKCPFMDDQYSCQSLLQEREIRSLVSKEEYDKHLTRSIRQAENKMENTYHCKTPNCRGWCIFEETLNTFRCPVCTMVNCLTCRAVHDGINCKQYQDQLSNDADSESAKQTKQLLQDLIDKEEALNCPTCHIFLLKKWGCDWLKCSFCKTEICWVTRGPRWGPNGKGDTSAGCKCGVGGKKCSTKCNYCH